MTEKHGKQIWTFFYGKTRDTVVKSYGSVSVNSSTIDSKRLMVS